MTNAQIISQIKELNEYEQLLEEIKAHTEAIKDSLKAHMDSLGTEELTVGTYIIRYRNVLSQRFNATAFKKDYEEVYLRYTHQISSKRFSISC